MFSKITIIFILGPATLALDDQCPLLIARNGINGCQLMLLITCFKSADQVNCEGLFYRCLLFANRNNTEWIICFLS